MVRAILKEKIEETYLIVNVMDDPKIKNAMANKTQELVVNDGKEDDGSIPTDKATEEEKMKMGYIILEFVGEWYVLYLHLRRLRPVKLCIYEVVG